MGKKNKKAKSAVADSETGMPRHLRREILTIANELLEKCSLPFGSRSTEWNDFLDVYQVVEKLRKKQQNYVLHHDDRDESLSGFVSWLQANKIDTGAVAIADFGENGYGLKAARDVKANELFMTIPRKLMLTTQTARNSILGPLIAEDRILQSMPNVVMALHVLCEFSQQDSFWMPYLKFLPKSYSTGLYFNPEEIQLLKASPTLSDILNQFRNITRQYSYFFRLFQGHPEASKLPIKNLCFDDYRWAVSTVMTRQNQIPSGSGDDEMDTALIPLWDMCNHTNGQITTDFNRDLDRSECLSLRDFQQNEEVLIFYGPRSNAELLLHSGFVYEGNEFDRLALRVGVSKNDTLYSMKAEVLARIPLNSNCTFYLHADALNPVDGDLLAYLRVFSMDHAALFEHMFGDGSSERQQNLKEFLKPVSKANEIKAWSFLETRAQILLRAYPTTLQEDDEILLKGGLSENSRLAVKLRRCEKRILLNVVEYCGAQKERVLEHFFANDDCCLVSDSHHGEEIVAPCPCGKFSDVHIHHGGSTNDKGDDGVRGEEQSIVGGGGGEIAGNEKGDFETAALESGKLENGVEEGEGKPECLSADHSDRPVDAAAAAAAADN